MSSACARLLTGIVLAFLLPLSASSQPPAASLRCRHGNTISALAFSPDGKTLATAGWDKTVRLWDTTTGKEIRSLIGHQAEVEALAFAPDGKTLASSGWDQTVRLWDVSSGKELRLLGQHPDGVLAIAFSPDGKLLASGNQDQKNRQGTLHLWDAATGKKLPLFSGHIGPVTAVAFSPDSRFLASGGVDQTIRLAEVATGKEVRRFTGHQNWIFSVAFAPDGKTLASGSGDKTVRLWETATGREIRQLTGHQDKVRSIAFSADGKTLASGGFDRTLRLWEVATLKERCQLRGHAGGVRTVAFAPDGRTVATGSSDGNALIGDPFRLLPEGQPKGEIAAKELEGLWNDLAGADPVSAFRAMAALAAVPGQAVPFVRDRLQQPPAVDIARVNRLIAELDHDEFSVRQKASAELEKVVHLAAPLLRKALEAGPSLEVRRRIEQLLLKADGQSLSPDRLRTVRSVELLERIGNAEVRQVFQGLIDKALDPWVKQEAKAALERVERSAVGSRGKER